MSINVAVGWVAGKEASELVPLMGDAASEMPYGVAAE